MEFREMSGCIIYKFWMATHTDYINGLNLALNANAVEATEDNEGQPKLDATGKPVIYTLGDAKQFITSYLNTNIVPDNQHEAVAMYIDKFNQNLIGVRIHYFLINGFPDMSNKVVYSGPVYLWRVVEQGNGSYRVKRQLIKSVSNRVPKSKSPHDGSAGPGPAPLVAPDPAHSVTPDQVLTTDISSVNPDSSSADDLITFMANLHVNGGKRKSRRRRRKSKRKSSRRRKY
jgi:hypothetical protein